VWLRDDCNTHKLDGSLTFVASSRHDLELVRAVGQGDDVALEALFRRHRALRRLRDLYLEMERDECAANEPDGP
jgi:hypothetical protein